MARSDVTLCSWNSPASLSDFISPDLCPPNNPVDYGICGLIQERVYIVQTPVRDTSRCDQRLEALSSASSTHGQAYHKTSSKKQLVNAVSGTCKHEGKIISLWTPAKLKPAIFRANTLHNRLFSESPTVYRGKCVVLRHFHRSHLKANKVSKSDGIRKVEYAYHFWKCADAVDRKLSKLVDACQN